MSMDADTLSRLKLWLKRAARPVAKEGDKRAAVAARVRRWRDQRRGGPPRSVTDWRTATVCAMANHPLTPENVRVEPNGQRSCRACLNRRIREWRRKQRAIRKLQRGLVTAL